MSEMIVSYDKLYNEIKEALISYRQQAMLP